jgi:hypothetical protein
LDGKKHINYISSVKIPAGCKVTIGASDSSSAVGGGPMVYEGPKNVQWDGDLFNDDATQIKVEQM